MHICIVFGNDLTVYLNRNTVDFLIKHLRQLGYDGSEQSTDVVLWVLGLS